MNDLKELALRLRVGMAVGDQQPDAVAQAVGCAPETLSRIIHGRQRPSEDLLARIEKAISRGEGRRGAERVAQGLDAKIGDPAALRRLALLLAAEGGASDA